MTEPQKFRKRPVIVEAMHWDGTPEGAVPIQRWANTSPATASTVVLDTTDPADPYLSVQTLEGVMMADAGDWIVKGTRDEFYPCKPGPFADTFRLEGAPRSDNAMPEVLDALIADVERNAAAIVTDMLLYGEAFTVDGQRVDPASVTIRGRKAVEMIVDEPPGDGGDVRDWIDYGVRQGWVTEACLTHDGVPSTPEEDELWEETDPCQYILRLWPDGKPPAGSAGEREHLRANEPTKVVGHVESTREFVADGNIYRVLRIDPVHGRDSDSDGVVEDGQAK